MIHLNKKLIDHIDKRSIDLIGLIEKSNSERPKQPILTKDHGSFSAKHKVKLTTTPKLGEVDLSKKRYTGETIGRWKENDDERVGFGPTNYPQLQKLIHTIYKNKDIHSVVSYAFLETVIFNWLIETFRKGQSESNLSQHLIKEIEESIVEQTYCFPILNLEITEPFQIGDITIKFFTDADFDELKSHNTGDENDVLRKKYKGTVVASTSFKGEPTLGENLSLSKCLVAIDILKICSDTIVIPDFELTFDIDMRSQYQLKSQTIIHAIDSFSSVNFNYKKIPNNHFINKEYLGRLSARELWKIGEYIFNTHPEGELFELIVLAISNFANALSNGDLHKRIAEMFTVFESLLLRNSNSGILDNLTKYAPKIIHKNANERAEIKDLLKEMYIIRSSLVHHGKKDEIDNNKLKQLQICLFTLIIELINKSMSHKSKESILDEIDHAINEAY